MRQLGADPRPLLRRHGLDPSTLGEPDSLISLRATMALMEESAALTGCPDFGLRLAARQDSSVLGLVALVIQGAPTVSDAAKDVSRYLFLHSPAFEVFLDEQSALFDDCSALRFEIRMTAHSQQRQSIDASIAHMFQLSRLLCGEDFHLRGVSLPHTPIAAESVYRRFFGAPVYFEQPSAALHAHRSFLQADLRDANPVLRRLALEHIEQRFKPRMALFSERVRQTLSGTIGANKGTKAEIAALLGMHSRTMQRRLHPEGLTFESIRDEVYKGAALQFLHETDMPLNQIAGALGFSQQSALTRACQRWFASTPSRIRARSRSGHIAQKDRPF